MEQILQGGVRSCLSTVKRGSPCEAVAQVPVCSSKTRNLPLSFLDLLDPEGPNSSRHAMSPGTTEACIVTSAGRATLSPAPAHRVLRLLCLVLLPVRSCPSARAGDLTRLRVCSLRQRGVFSLSKHAGCRNSMAWSSTEKNDPGKMSLLRSRFHRTP